MKQLERLALEFWLQIGQLPDALEWAEAEVASGLAEPDTYRLFEADEAFAASLVADLARARGFDPAGREGWSVAISLLRDQAQVLLEGRLGPAEFCRLVTTVEANFRTFVSEREQEWLNGLWNACDWCQETSTIDDCPALRTSATHFLEVSSEG